MKYATSTCICLIALAVSSTPQESPGQLISVQCCTQQSDLEQIGLCVSGPDGFERPAECTAGATCILGFGNDDSMMSGLCDPFRPVPDISRGFCDSWAIESISALHQCVAYPNEGITLFEVFDVAEQCVPVPHVQECNPWADGQDGDLDVVDLSAFYAAYDAVPKLEQAEAKLVLVECCIPSTLPSELGQCLSGPGNLNEPPYCAIEPVCTAGFTAALEPGDRLYKTCAQIQDDSEPIPPLLYCQSWQTPPLPPAFECRAAHLPGHSLFVIADLDGDEDVDLADYAAIQRSTP